MSRFSHYILCFVLVSFGISTKGQTTYVPDDNFEAYLETHDASGNVVSVGDANSMGDGIASNDYVTTANISEVTQLIPTNLSISDATGIEDFSSLTTLGFDHNQITNIDISQNTSLTFFSIPDNQISSLYLSQNSNLTTIYCNDNQITSLDVSSLDNLTYLNCSNNQLSSLNIANKNYFHKTGGGPTFLEMITSNNTNLSCIQVYDSTYSIPTQSAPHLANDVYKIFSGVNFTVDTHSYFSTDCSNSGNPQNNGTYKSTTYIPDDGFEVFLEDNGLGDGIYLNDSVFTSAIDTVTRLDLIANTAYSGGPQYSEFNNLTVHWQIYDFTGLESFSNLSKLHILGLEQLNSQTGINISNLDLSPNTLLAKLVFVGNSNSNSFSLNINSNSLLTYLDLHFNFLDNLNLSGNPILSYVDVNMNQLTSLDVRNGNNSNFTSFNATGNSNLYCISVDDENYSTDNWTTIDSHTSFSDNCNAKTFIRDYDTQWGTNDNFEAYLETHDANGNNVGGSYGNFSPTSSCLGDGIWDNDSVLTYKLKNVNLLDLRNYPISDLTGIQNFVNLDTLYTNATYCCSSNQNGLDFSQNEKLRYLDVSSSPLLNQLDISQNDSLRYLSAYGCNLSNINLLNNTFLHTLWIADNSIDSLDLSNSSSLAGLDFQNNPNLVFVDLRNGNNQNLWNWNSLNTPSLNCVSVDDETSWPGTFSSVVGSHTFSNNCSVAANTDPVFSSTAITTATVGISYSYSITATDADGDALTFSGTTIPSWLTLTDNGDNTATLTGSPTVGGTNNVVITLFDGNGGTSTQNFDITVPFLPKTYVPDDNFEAYLETHDASGNVVSVGDANSMGDGIANNDSVTTANISGVTGSLYVNNLNISDLTGIEDFSSLTWLNCNNNQLSILDLSQNTSLTNLHCNYNQLTNLDLSQNTNLTSLKCTNNQLANLDLSANTSIQSLNCAYNSINSLDVGLNYSLTEITCNNNQISVLDLKPCSLLIFINCRNNYLHTLDIRNCDISNFSNFGINNNWNLRCVSVDDPSYPIGNWSNSFQYDNHTSFSPNCDKTYVPDDNFEAYLETHDVSGNVVTVGDANSMGDGIANNDSVTTANIRGVNNLDIQSKNIADLTGIEDFNSITTLNCSSNQLTSLDLSQNTALTILLCGNNRNLNTLNVSQNTFLTELYVYFGSLSGLDLSQNSALNKLSVFGNILSSLDVSQNTSLTYLDIEGNVLTSLDVSQNTNLTYINCTNNQLTSLDISSNTALDTLFSSYNQLSILDLSHNISLRNLRCDYNQLTSIDVSNNAALTFLYCDYNQLTSLDVRNGNNTNLTGFSASGNSNLNCISVDDATWATANWTNIDSHTSFSDDCNAVPKTYVPDDNFEAYLETHDASGNVVSVGDANSMGDGIANNDYVTTANISGVTSLYVNNQNISDLTGIEDFTSLQVFDCQNNQISSIDLSNNSSLTNITIGYNPPLFQLDLRNGNNINITNLNVYTGGILRCISVDDENWSNSNWTNNNNFYLNCVKFSNNCFQKVYVPDDDFEAFLETRALTLGIQPHLSNNSYCAGVGFFSSETVSVGDSNSLGDGIADNDSVYLGNLIAIEALSPSVGINFEGIQFMKNLKYFKYNVSPKTNFTSVDFSQNDSLEIIIITESHLTDINLPINSNLEYVDLRNNHISNLDLTNQTKLTYLDISEQSELSSQNNTTRILNQLDVSNSPLITTLKCNDNNLSTLNLSSNTNIENLYCQENELASLNLSAFSNLKHLECNGNNLTSLSVSNSPLLNYLVCSENQLSSISLTGNSKIETLFCGSNTINSLDLTGLDSLRYLDCQSNGMTNLNVSTNPDLLELQCGYNNLSQINLSNNLNLDWIHIDQNPNLTFLDLSSNVNLTRASFQGNWNSDVDQLSCVDLRNGNNSNISLSATSNNNLYCISVDDTVYANANWSSSVDSHTGFSENCNLISSDFTANRTSICKGTSVQFSNNSSINSYSSIWNFGVGNSSSATNPTNTYANSGNYTVSLNINNGCSNDVETKANFITVSNQSNVINNIDTSVVDSIIIAGVSHYLSSTIQEILVAQNGCDSIVNHNITINKLLSSELNATDTVVCIGDAVTIGINILDSAERSFDPFIIKVDAHKTLVLDKFHGQYHIKSTDSATGNIEYFYNLLDNDTLTFTENSGTYTLEIHPTGQVPFNGISHDQSYSNHNLQELTEILDWGTVEWTSLRMAFYYCENLRLVNPSSTPDLSSVANLSYMFAGCWKYLNSSINHWDVSNITNMSYMFYQCREYNQSLNNWNVGNVSDMSYMFMGAFRDFIYSHSLNNWDVGNVTNMTAMFASSGFNGNISNWNVSNVTNMTYMFEWAQEFNQNLNSWNLNSSVQIWGMFRLCRKFNQPLNNWDVSGNLIFTSLFNNCESFNQDLSSWDVSNGTNFSYMFQGANVFNQDISSWDVSSGTEFWAMFLYCYQFNQNLNSWNMSNATEISGMFQNCTNFNQPLNSWDISGVSNLRYMFKEASSFNQDISSWDVSNVTEMDYIFDNATSFNQTLDNWNVSNVTNFEKAFNNCTSFNQSLSNWNVSSSSNLDLMFFGASNFNSDLTNWCVTNFNSEPLGFSTQTSLINNNKPLWGTCP